jgi:hypothetical protein
MRIALTEAICFAAGRDAGNASMRKAGRKVWAQADYDAACEEFKRLDKLRREAERDAVNAYAEHMIRRDQRKRLTGE